MNSYPELEGVLILLDPNTEVLVPLVEVVPNPVVFGGLLLPNASCFVLETRTWIRMFGTG
jgi:hypothetical protein